MSIVNAGKSCEIQLSLAGLTVEDQKKVVVTIQGMRSRISSVWTTHSEWLHVTANFGNLSDERASKAKDELHSKISQIIEHKLETAKKKTITV